MGSWMEGLGSNSLAGDRLVAEYLSLQPPSFFARRRHYALFKALSLFMSLYGVGSLEEALRKCRENGDLHRVLQAFVSSLEGEGLKPKTIIFYLTVLTSFFRFYDVPYEAALRKIRKPKKATIRVDRLPSVADLQKMILGSKSRRLSMLIQLLAQTGMRLSEALNLRVEYIDLENNVINLPGSITKTGKPRQIPLISELKIALKSYLKAMGIESGYVFPSEGDRGKPWTIERVYMRYHRLLKRLGLDQRDSIGYQMHLHTLRKWFKTQLEMANVNRLLIMSWMGHDIGVQGVYFMPSPSEVKKEIEKAEAALTIFGTKQSMMESEQIRAELENLKRLVAENAALLLETIILRDPEGAKNFLRRNPELLKKYLEGLRERMMAEALQIKNPKRRKRVENIIQGINPEKEARRIILDEERLENFIRSIILKGAE